MWFDVERQRLDFCEQSKNRIENHVELGCSAARAFELLTASETMSSWVHDCIACTWISSPPRGVGSTREVVLKGMIVREEFIAWDPGVRMAFTLYEMTVPLLRRMIEDFQIRSTGDASCAIDWTVHYEVRGFAKPFHPIARSKFGKLFAKSGRNLERLTSGG